MSASFSTTAWPLVNAIILMAGSMVTIAAVTTMITAITRAHPSTQKHQADEGAYQPSPRPIPQDPTVMETMTTDGIHFIPIP